MDFLHGTHSFTTIMFAFVVLLSCVSSHSYYKCLHVTDLREWIDIHAGLVGRLPTNDVLRVVELRQHIGRYLDGIQVAQPTVVNVQHTEFQLCYPYEILMAIAEDKLNARQMGCAKPVFVPVHSVPQEMRAVLTPPVAGVEVYDKILCVAGFGPWTSFFGSIPMNHELIRERIWEYLKQCGPSFPLPKQIYVYGDNHVDLHFASQDSMETVELSMEKFQKGCTKPFLMQTKKVTPDTGICTCPQCDVGYSGVPAAVAAQTTPQTGGQTPTTVLESLLTSEVYAQPTPVQPSAAVASTQGQVPTYAISDRKLAMSPAPAALPLHMSGSVPQSVITSTVFDSAVPPMAAGEACQKWAQEQVPVPIPVFRTVSDIPQANLASPMTVTVSMAFVTPSDQATAMPLPPVTAGHSLTARLQPQTVTSPHIAPTPGMVPKHDNFGGSVPPVAATGGASHSHLPVQAVPSPSQPGVTCLPTQSSIPAANGIIGYVLTPIASKDTQDTGPATAPSALPTPGSGSIHVRRSYVPQDTTTEEAQIQLDHPTRGFLGFRINFALMDVSDETIQRWLEYRRLPRAQRLVRYPEEDQIGVYFHDMNDATNAIKKLRSNPEILSDAMLRDMTHTDVTLRVQNCPLVDKWMQFIPMRDGRDEVTFIQEVKKDLEKIPTFHPTDVRWRFNPRSVILRFRNQWETTQALKALRHCHCDVKKIAHLEMFETNVQAPDGSYVRTEWMVDPK